MFISSFDYKLVLLLISIVFHHYYVRKAFCPSSHIKHHTCNTVFDYCHINRAISSVLRGFYYFFLFRSLMAFGGRMLLEMWFICCFYVVIRHTHYSSARRYPLPDSQLLITASSTYQTELKGFLSDLWLICPPLFTLQLGFALYDGGDDECCTPIIFPIGRWQRKLTRPPITHATVWRHCWGPFTSDDVILFSWFSCLWPQNAIYFRCEGTNI